MGIPADETKENGENMEEERNDQLEVGCYDLLDTLFTSHF